MATDEDGDGTANVYDPPDAIAGAAKYLLEFGVQSNPSAAIFAYNHLQSYVQSVLMYAGQYAGGNFSVASAQLPAANSAAGCVQTAGGVPAVQAPTQAVATAISFAEQQLGKPYLWGGTGPDAFDCSGLMHDGLPDGGDQHRAHLAGAVGHRDQGPRLPGSARGPGVLRRRGRYRHRSGPRRPGDREREDDRGLRDRLPDPHLQLRQPRRDRLHRTLGRRQGHDPRHPALSGQHRLPGSTHRRTGTPGTPPAPTGGIPIPGSAVSPSLARHPLPQPPGGPQAAPTPLTARTGR